MKANQKHVVICTVCPRVIIYHFPQHKLSMEKVDSLKLCFPLSVLKIKRHWTAPLKLKHLNWKKTSAKCSENFVENYFQWKRKICILRLILLLHKWQIISAKFWCLICDAQLALNWYIWTIDLSRTRTFCCWWCKLILSLK